MPSSPDNTDLSAYQAQADARQAAQHTDIHARTAPPEPEPVPVAVPEVEPS